MADLFKEKAKDWDASEKKTNMAASIGSSIFDHVDLNASMTVMDFGAGTGLIAAQIAPRVNRIVAVDTSEAMLEKLAQKPELKDKVETVCQDIIDQPLDSQFDLIVSAMAMHHVKDTSRLMQTFSNLLNDSGIVALCDLDKEDGSFHSAGTEGVYHSGFDRQALAELMEKQGFSEIEFTTAHIFKGEEKDYPLFLVTARKA